MKFNCLRLLLPLITTFITTTSFAQSNDQWPNKPIKIIVPYGAAGSSDTLARMLSEQLTQSLKQSVIVENKSGAGGTIGSDFVAKSMPDGYTFVISGLASHVIAPVQYKNKYNPIKDFSHIAYLGGPPLALVVSSKTPITDLKSFINYVKAQPEGISYGSPGIGTHGHVIAEYFASVVGIKMNHIGYKGGSSAVNDIAGGQLPAGFMTLTSAKTLIQSGKLRLIAVTSSKRVNTFPNTPTFAELGYPQLTSITWFGVSGPQGIPPNIAIKFNQEINRAMHSPQAKEKLNFEDMEYIEMDTDKFNQFILKEINTWAPLAKKVLP